MNEPCPLCDHLMHEHDPELGCTSGWIYSTVYGNEGVAVRDGCTCPITLAAVHRQGYVHDDGTPVA